MDAQEYTAALTLDTTAVIRAVVWVDGLPATQVFTHTYLFPDDVVLQSDTPAGYPTDWGRSAQDNAVAADYAMDPTIVAEHPDIADDLTAMRPGLTEASTTASIPCTGATASRRA